MRKRHLILATLTAASAVAAVTITGLATAEPAPDQKHRSVDASAVDDAADLDDYWTPERIAAAETVPAPDVGGAATDAVPTSGEPLSVDGTHADDVDSQSPVDVTIGRLLFTTDDGDSACSANVVPSENGSVIATARHCGFENNGRNYRFAPDYDSGETPHGWWDWKTAGFTSGGDAIAFDYAFIVLDKKDDQTVEETVGSSGIAFNNDIDRDAQITGIPVETDTAFDCNGPAYDGGDRQQLMDDCDGMSGGASGGAWLHDMDGNTGYQVGTYFGSSGDAAAGSYFGEEAREVWEGAASEEV